MLKSESLVKLYGLCHELDIELDGVKVPASAAAILNSIRETLKEAKEE